MMRFYWQMKSAVYLLVVTLAIVSQQHEQNERQPRSPAFFYWQPPFYPSWTHPAAGTEQLSDLVSEVRVCSVGTCNRVSCNWL